LTTTDLDAGPLSRTACQDISDKRPFPGWQTQSISQILIDIL
jgi:hypothetical protein